MSEVRLFIGAPEYGYDAESQMVCEATLRKYASRPLSITWLCHSEDPASPLYGWDRSAWATPFSGYRWCVPALAGDGRAIYLDCDTICQADIVELWEMELPPGRVVAARGGWRFCVSLWDVPEALNVLMPLERLKQADGHQKQNDFFRRNVTLTHNFGSSWNYLDDEDYAPIKSAKIVHYTSLWTQPSMRYAVPRLTAEGRAHWNKRRVAKHPRLQVTELFDRAFSEARAAGYTPQQYY